MNAQKCAHLVFTTPLNGCYVDIGTASPMSIGNVFWLARRVWSSTFSIRSRPIFIDTIITIFVFNLQVKQLLSLSLSSIQIAIRSISQLELHINYSVCPFSCVLSHARLIFNLLECWHFSFGIHGFISSKTKIKC